MTVLFPNTKHDPVGGAWGLGTVSGYPCAGDVSSMFGATDMDLHSEGHNGTDIAAGQGTPILAPCDMLITDVFSLAIEGDPEWDEFKRLFGNSVWATIGLSDGTGYRTMFAHMAEPPSVYEGQAVEAGTLLGVVGDTGMAEGPHLHWTLGPLENRWLARNAGNVEVLDYCGDGDTIVLTADAWTESGATDVANPVVAPTGSGVIIDDKHATALKALQDARAAIDRATAAMY